MKLILQILAIVYIFNSPIYASQNGLLDGSSPETRVERPKKCCSFTNCLLFLVSAGVGLIAGYGYKAYGSAEGVIGDLHDQLNSCVTRLDQTERVLQNVTQSAVNDCSQYAVNAMSDCSGIAKAAVSAATEACISACGKK